MKQQIFYVMSGRPHLPYLITSLYTLRYLSSNQLPVHIYAWDESFPIVKRICEDPRLRDWVSYEAADPTYKGKNSQFLHKMICGMQHSADLKLYLDADTTIHGSLQPLFDQLEGEECGFLATQFNNWTTHGIVRRRLERLLDREGIPQDSLKKAILEPYPSVNGGIWGCRPDTPILSEWHKRTSAVKRDVFIADECVLHTFLPEGLPVLEGGAFNTSPIVRYRNPELPLEDVVIMHYHGDSNVKWSADKGFKSREGFETWWPLWAEVLYLNLGYVREWQDMAGNKYIKRIENREAQGELT